MHLLQNFSKLFVSKTVLMNCAHILLLGLASVRKILFLGEGRRVEFLTENMRIK